MFVVIQEILLKKPDKYGEYKVLEPYQESWTVDNKPACWRWRYAGERFERPHLEAYKISVHESYRENGKVQKHQYSICTMSYYDIVGFSFEECTNKDRLENIAEKLGISYEQLCDMVYTKLDPLDKRIQREYQQSEEYITYRVHQDIIGKSNEDQTAFMKKYHVEANDYLRCYDVFGKLVNPEYLKQIKKQSKSYRSYYSYGNSNYNSYSSQTNSNDYSSYFSKISSTYSADEKSILKQFYKALSVKYHPDMNRDKDTTQEMQLLNKLKDDWGL